MTMLRDLLDKQTLVVAGTSVVAILAVWGLIKITATLLEQQVGMQEALRANTTALVANTEVTRTFKTLLEDTRARNALEQMVASVLRVIPK